MLDLISTFMKTTSTKSCSSRITNEHSTLKRKCKKEEEPYIALWNRHCGMKFLLCTKQYWDRSLLRERRGTKQWKRRIKKKKNKLKIKLVSKTFQSPRKSSHSETSSAWIPPPAWKFSSPTSPPSLTSSWSVVWSSQLVGSQLCTHLPCLGTHWLKRQGLESGSGTWWSSILCLYFLLSLCSN